MERGPVVGRAQPRPSGAQTPQKPRETEKRGRERERGTGSAKSGCERESSVGEREREGERHAPGVRGRATGVRERGKDENEKP
jgi:hypothetical protein